jgi:hypothetical protein
VYYRPVKIQQAPTEYDRFTRLVDRVLSVPKAEIVKREEEYQKTSPRSKRGPKPTASRDSDVSGA